MIRYLYAVPDQCTVLCSAVHSVVQRNALCTAHKGYTMCKCVEPTCSNVVEYIGPQTTLMIVSLIAILLYIGGVTYCATVEMPVWERADCRVHPVRVLCVVWASSAYRT
jgi:hypothetical protein